MKIGDKISNVELENIKNYKNGTAKISDFKGKLIILDFWDKNCTACIRAFPKMEGLQERFSDKIQILLVARNKEEELNPLFQNNPNVKNTKLPILIGDTALHRLFPHTVVPFHVWIDGNGIVRATTYSESTTAGNIQRFLDSGFADLPVRIDVMDENIRKQSLLEQLLSANQLSNVISYSILTKKHTGENQSSKGFTYDSLGRLNGVRLMNLSIIDLYRNVYGSSIGKVIVDPAAPDRLEIYYPPADRNRLSEWNYNNFYCYELKIQSCASLSQNDLEQYVRNTMCNDLDAKFFIKSSLQIRDVVCLVLYRTSTKIDQLESKTINPVFEPMKDGTWIIRNYSFSIIPGSIEAYLEHRLGRKDSPIVIDETGYKKNIDIDIKLSDDLSILNKQLSKYGLILRKENRKMKCLILKENN